MPYSICAAWQPKTKWSCRSHKRKKYLHLRNKSSRHTFYLQNDKCMPMKNFSTRCLDEHNSKIEKNGDVDKSSSPRKKTLDFLTQFARVYHVEPELKESLCGLVMN